MVMAVTAEGSVTLRGLDVPEGTLVKDPTGRFTGKVVRVFGPVSDPYISVRPRRATSAKETLALVGKTLVTMEVRGA